MFPVALGFLDSPLEIALVLLIVVLLFGSAKIPELARNLGKAKSEFQRAAQEGNAQARAPAASANEEEKTIKAARELGIPTEGRSLADIKADIRKKLA
jgi:sec-independent protein translocase protein TatA